jgi:hypothetical protein
LPTVTNFDENFRKENTSYVPAFFAAAIIGENRTPPRLVDASALVFSQIEKIESKSKNQKRREE